MRTCGMIDCMAKRRGKGTVNVDEVLNIYIKSHDVCLKYIGGMVLLLPVSEKAKRWLLIAALFVQWIVELLCKVRWYVCVLLGLVLC